MNKTSGTSKDAADKLVKGIKRVTRKQYSAEEKIRIVLADYLDDKGMDHVRGAPYHLQTHGKIERWHQTMKNRVLLEHYFLPGDLERQINRLRRLLQQRALPREPRKPDARRRLLRARSADPETARGDQTQNHAHAALALPN